MIWPTLFDCRSYNPIPEGIPPDTQKESKLHRENLIDKSLDKQALLGFPILSISRLHIFCPILFPHSCPYFIEPKHKNGQFPLYPGSSFCRLLCILIK